MADRSRIDLVNQALEELRERPAGQAAAPEDFALVNIRVPAMIEDLRERGVCNVQDVEAAIPESFFDHLASLLAMRCRNAFGMNRDYMGEKAIESDIRRITGGRPSGQVLAVDYF